MKKFSTHNKFSNILCNEGVRFHLENNIPFHENIFRYGSKEFYNFFVEVRGLYNGGEIEVTNEADLEIIGTDIGLFGIYEGEEVPLDCPMMEEESVNEVRMGPFMKKMNIQKGDTVEVNLTASGPIGKSGRYKLKVKDVGKQFITLELPNKRTSKFRIKDGSAVDVDAQIVGKINEEKDVELNSPKRGGNKKYYVYVKNDKGNVIKVEFGDTSGLKAKIDDSEARKSFVARHKCSEKKDKTKPGYWACRLPRYAKALGLSGGGDFYW
jgi:hypothetical protein